MTEPHLFSGNRLALTLSPLLLNQGMAFGKLSPGGAGANGEIDTDPQGVEQHVRTALFDPSGVALNALRWSDLPLATLAGAGGGGRER